MSSIDMERGRPLLSDDVAEHSYSLTRGGPAQPSTLLPCFQRHRTLLSLSLLLSVLVVLLALALAVIVRGNEADSSLAAGPSTTPRTAAAVAQCLSEHLAAVSSSRDASPRTPDGHTPAILLRNATIHDGIRPAFTGDVLLEGGVIKAVGPDLSSSAAGARVIEVGGRHLTPGLVDMHSHVGVSAFPVDIWATSDTNEGTNPIFPQVRTIDAIDVQDPAIPLVRSGGVTTVQILPGSGNAMGGQGALLKLKDSTRVEELLVPGAPRLLKMACGENPKRSYGRSKGVTPSTRMGAAWIMRQAFEAAYGVMQAQKDWCQQEQPTTPFPHPLALQSLAGLLRGEVRLHTHCYTPTDLQMMLRLSDEFGFNVSAFHHAMSAWRVTDVLRDRNITIATFADQWGHKYEQTDSSVSQGKKLEEAGVAVALKSDHPVFNSQFLVFEGVKSHHWGLSYDGTIAALTSTPARAIGLGNRLGSIKPGLDADVVVWDRDPLALGARPVKLFIDGQPWVDRDVSGPASPPRPTPGAPQTCGPNSPQETLNCYAVVDVEAFLMIDNGGGDGRQSVKSATIVVQDGVVSCAGAGCSVPDGCRRVVQEKGVVIPGLIEAGSHIGQLELVQEARTQDGINDGASADGAYSTISALDGLHVFGRHFDSARRGGVLSVIDPPLVNSQLVVGLSTIVHTASRTANGTRDVFADHNLVQHRVALHLSLGNSAKNSGLTNSVSGQLAALRALFERAQRALLFSSSAATLESDPLWAFQQALQLRLPVSVDVNSADQMSSLLRLQRQFGFQLIVQGGAEAHLLADDLAATVPKTSVILTSRVPPSAFESRRIRDDALAILRRAGVPFGIQYADPNLAMNLRWELGFQQGWNGLTVYDAVQAATSSIVEIFGIGRGGAARGRTTDWARGLGRIEVGTPANLLLFNGDPIGAEASLQLIALGRDIECRPVQL